MRIFLFWVWFLCAASVCPQSTRFRVMEYNVENLFDCRHDSLKDDAEFLPDGTNRWTYRKYRDKLVKLAKVIAAVGEEQLPDLVALCEVENERVLLDLTRRSPLREAGYRFVLTDSPDERGIDVALLYQRGRFRLLASRSYRLPRNPKTGRPTRDILHVTGLVPTLDTLDVFVCHLPSRSGGERLTRAYRYSVARRLRALCDSVMDVRGEARLLVTGDFNEEPSNEALRKVLHVRPFADTVCTRALYNLMDGRRPGTYRYKGEWNLLDHLLVSGRLLLESKGIFTRREDASIVQYPFLLEDDRAFGGQKPFRTHIGPRYHGGFSDHLPIYADFWLPE